MNTYRVEVEVKGYITTMVKARSQRAAEDKALDISMTMPVGDLEDKTATVVVIEKKEKC